MISKPKRKENGYRVFNDLHIAQFQLSRKALEIEVLQGGLRDQIIQVVKLTALQEYDQAIQLTRDYIARTEIEMEHAKSAIESTNAVLQGKVTTSPMLKKRKEVSELLGIPMDTLRNWEMNGLLKVKRKANGYRVYDEHDMERLMIIRSLRCANYSLSAILRMMNALSVNAKTDVEIALNTPNSDEDIVSACDKLISSLEDARSNAESILKMISEMKRIY